MSTFPSLPQRRPNSHNAHWTKNALAEKSRRQPTPRNLAANRAKIARIEELVRRGKIKPLEIPMGQHSL